MFQLEPWRATLVESSKLKMEMICSFIWFLFLSVHNNCLHHMVLVTIS